MTFPETKTSSVSIVCKGVLFDMDGILISSLEAAKRAWRRWADGRGIPHEQVLAIMHGRRAIETVSILCPDRDPESELKVIEDFELEDTEGLKVLPGVHQLLDRMPRERWTVVTSATEALARLRLGIAQIPVPTKIVTAEFVTRGKPHPEPFLLGAEVLGFRPADCVVFEDSASGVLAGRAAGCTLVGTTFSHPVEELSAAHYVIGDLTGVSVEVFGAEMLLRLTPLANRPAIGSQ